MPTPAWKPTPKASADNGSYNYITLHAAAAEWWEAKRPAGWSLEQHLADPAVNVTGHLEVRLAYETADAVKAKQARDRRFKEQWQIPQTN